MTGISALRAGQRLHDLLTLHTHSGVLTRFVESILFVQRAYVATREALKSNVPKYLAKVSTIVGFNKLSVGSSVVCFFRCWNQSSYYTTPFLP